MNLSNNNDRRSRMQRENGVALIMAVVVLTVLSVMIMGVARDVDLDLGITANVRLQHDAFNWTQAGMDIAEEMIGYAVDTRGDDDDDTPVSKTVGSSNYTVDNPGSTLFLSNGTVNLSRDGRTLSSSRVEYLGTRQTEGGSIIIASGYEGVGKSAAAGTGAVVLYCIETNGSSAVADGRSRAAEVYRVTGIGY